ncbi:hypothetical protein QCA50_008559 [Cerrena zonata]|uniref:Uncharacterized protein n=1 Tax=Cerrena zonata TaxID=2478898 RepID=A0AAW0FI55_9APHY
MQPVYAALAGSAHDDDVNDPEFNPLVRFQMDEASRRFDHSATKHVSKRMLMMVYILCSLTTLVLFINVVFAIRDVRHHKVKIGTLARPGIFDTGTVSTM